VGLLISDAEGKLHVLEKARNPALQVTPDPTLKYGDCRPEVKQAVEKFNQTDRKMACVTYVKSLSARPRSLPCEPRDEAF